MNVASPDVVKRETDRRFLMKTLRLAAALAGLLAIAPMLAACHTTAGVGEDLSQGGHVLTNSANANTPASPHP